MAYAAIVRKIAIVGVLVGSVSLQAADGLLQPGTMLDPEPLASPQGRGLRGRPVEGYYKGQISPHWFGEGRRFWYRNDLSGRTKAFVLVDAEAGARRPAFDHARLAAALSEATGESIEQAKLPFDSIEFVDGVTRVRFEVDGTPWGCDLEDYRCTESDEPMSEASQTDDAGRGRRRRGGGGRGSSRRVESPNGEWTAFVEEHNIHLQARDSEEGQSLPLTSDGVEDNDYGVVSWSPDSQHLVAYRVEPGDGKEVYLIESSPQGGGRATLRSRPYDLPGDRFAHYELNLFDIRTQKQIKPEVDYFEHGWLRPAVHWSQDGSFFSYLQVDRGHQRLRVIKVEVPSGAVSNVIDEKTDTFIWTAHTEGLRLDLVNWLEQTDEIIYCSEMDGWRHLYLADAREGKIVKQITQGPWVIRGIDRIDEENRQIWFNASGKNAGEDPYFVHYYRVNFDGTGLVALTEGDGTHTIQYSPDRRFLIDSYSRVDRAPVHTLRRVSDGSLVCALERADISELMVQGFKPPEIFVAKGRDGKTDIWGIICRPKDFDASKPYPVIEQIYAGPQGAYVPKAFSPRNRFASLADLGFIVVQMDAMGTAYRSKAFHDVCWHNLKDAGFPDRILWHQAVAAKYPYYDIGRVGIYGTSAGGQNAAGAVLFHPEFYKAAVANSGCHDNRMDKASWNEQWMGYPVGPQYSECSNIDNAGKLGGYLFLIVGEADTNVPPESTLRFVDALIRAEKDFDLLVVPNANHGARSSITQRRLQDFFVHHLLGQEPPNRNAGES